MKTEQITKIAVAIHTKNSFFRDLQHLLYIGGNELESTYYRDYCIFFTPRARKVFFTTFFFQHQLHKNVVNLGNRVKKSVTTVLRWVFLKMQWSVFARKLPRKKMQSKKRSLMSEFREESDEAQNMVVIAQLMEDNNLSEQEAKEIILEQSQKETPKHTELCLCVR